MDGVSPIRSHGVRFNLRGRAKNTQESCWNVVVRPDANERFNRGIRGSHCRKVATMRAEGEIVLCTVDEWSNFVRKGTRTAFSLELRGILDIRTEIRLCFGKTASITGAGATRSPPFFRRCEAFPPSNDKARIAFPCIG